jgi:hypothetical protein
MVDTFALLYSVLKASVLGIVRIPTVFFEVIDTDSS